MASGPEVNNKMNNKVDGSTTPKPEPKSKVSFYFLRGTYQNQLIKYIIFALFLSLVTHRNQTLQPHRMKRLRGYMS